MEANTTLPAGLKPIIQFGDAVFFNVDDVIAQFKIAGIELKVYQLTHRIKRGEIAGRKVGKTWLAESNSLINWLSGGPENDVVYVEEGEDEENPETETAATSLNGISPIAEVPTPVEATA